MNGDDHTHKEHSCDDEPADKEAVEPSGREGYRDEDEQPAKPLFLQWRELKIDRRIESSVAVLGLLIAISVALVAIFQLAAMKDQAKSMQAQLDEMKASRRPWVNVKVEMVKGWESGPNIKAKYTMENLGTTPAIGVRIFPSAMLHPFGDENFGDENLTAKQRELCSRGKREGFGFGASVLFPQEKWSEEIEVGLGKALIKDVPALSGLQPGFPYLLGCVTYRFAFDDKSVHQTPYIYSISRTKPKYVANSSSATLDFGPVSSVGIFLNPVILKSTPIPD